MEELPPGGLAAGQFPGAAEELRRQEAFDVAWRFLGHRDRTEAEVRRNFTRKRVEPEFVEEVVAALLEGNYLDDAAFARRFAEDRRNLDGWGGERIERRLTELGVDRSTIREALAGNGDEDGGHDEHAAACELLARRFPVPPDTPRDLERAYDALRRHAAAEVEG